MKKILTITLSLTITGTLTVAAQTGRQLKVYMKGGLVDKVQVATDASIGHSRTDLNGTVHDDYVSAVVKDAEGRERQYLISQLDSLVMPNGRRVVFVGNQNGYVNGNVNDDENQNENGSRSLKRSSFSGKFPGAGTGNVTFKWTENDRIRLDAGYESRAEQLSADGTSASFYFDDADNLQAERYWVYFPDRRVTIKSVQTQTGANNSLHIYDSGDCGTAIATRNGDENDNENTEHPSPNTTNPSLTTYTFTLEHKAAYLCFLPHIDNLPSAKLTKITLSCSAAIAGTYLLSENGLYNASNTSSTITLNLVPQKNIDFFIGHDALTEQDSCAAYMVIVPQGASQTFMATYYITDTLSHISKVYRQTFSLKPEANTVYPVTCHILDEEFRTIDLGLSCNWSNVNVGAREPSKTGRTFDSDTAANVALLEQTVVTQWLMPDEDQCEEILEKCQWTFGEYNGQTGYFVEGAAVAKEYGEKLRIFLPCSTSSTKEQCLSQNFRPVEALMVDLGLSSGVKWAARNVGATSVEDYGNYYAWGEVEPYTGNYSYGTQTLGEAYDISGTQNDVALVKWGGLWHMPTKDNMQELRDSCSWDWNTINGVNGYIIQKKTGGTGNRIFLPSAGFMEGANTLLYSGGGGTYYTSTLEGDRETHVWTLYWNRDHNGSIEVSSREGDYWRYGGTYERSTTRSYGRSIRPVASPNAIASDGNSYNIHTDSAVWKLSDTEAVLYATLSSAYPIKGIINVGFVVGDSSTIIKGSARFELDKTVTNGGSFSLSLPVHDNIGYWFRAFIDLGDTVYYGNALHYGYDYVDLGLPTGTLWANMNLGASKPSDYGDYYAWGEVDVRAFYGAGANYKFGNMNLGTDYDLAGTEHDAAHVIMGNAWRMPTRKQMEELRTCCDWKWTSQDGINGYLVKSLKPGNTNSIFLPAAGFKDGSDSIYSICGGTYYTSTLENDRESHVWTLYWNKDHNSSIEVSSRDGDYWRFGGTYERSTTRYMGRSIRPVFVPNAVKADSTVVMNILTDSVIWKLDDSEAVIFGTLSSTTPIATGTKTGFVVGDSANITKDNATVYEQLTTVYGSFSQLITGITDNQSLWYRAYVETADSVYFGEPRHFGLEMVDLGLPSSTLWANMNVGASWPEDYGDYFAWGEIAPKPTYNSSSDNYPLGNQNPGGLLDIAGTEYDAATMNMGEIWHLPTRTQMEELHNSKICKWTWTVLDDINGFKITGPNGNSIFLPAAGFKDGSDSIYSICGGTYYTSTLENDRESHVWTLYWNKDHNSGIEVSSRDGDYWRFGGTYERSTTRYMGRSVRAVSEPNTVMIGDNLLKVETLPNDWTTGQAMATIKGTLTSDEVLASDVTVGFLVKNHYYTDCATVKTYHDIVVSAAGEFSLPQNINSDEGLYYTAYIKVGDSYYYGGTCHAGLREMVNLGLPSGKLWANLNLGAATEDEVGSYFAWGETEPKTTFSGDTYLLKTNDDYADLGSNISGTEYDAVHALWQGGWRMPTESDFSELVNNCVLSYVTVNGHPCYKAKSRVSDAYVLFPEGGIKVGDGVSNDANWAFYWTSNNSGASEARRTNFYGQGQWGMHYDNRAYGLLIKPIMYRE